MKDDRKPYGKIEFFRRFVANAIRSWRENPDDSGPRQQRVAGQIIGAFFTIPAGMVLGCGIGLGLSGLGILAAGAAGVATAVAFNRLTQSVTPLGSAVGATAGILAGGVLAGATGGLGLGLLCALGGGVALGVPTLYVGHHALDVIVAIGNGWYETRDRSAARAIPIDDEELMDFVERALSASEPAPQAGSANPYPRDDFRAAGVQPQEQTTAPQPAATAKKRTPTGLE